MKRPWLYSIFVVSLMFICLGYSSKIVLRTYQLPVTNIHNYNNVTKAVAFIYIPSTGSAVEYSCNFTINCGKIPFGKFTWIKFKLSPNKIKIINITIDNVSKPLLCLEHIVCQSTINPNDTVSTDEKITLYPFFETFPGQIHVQLITSNYWYLNKENDLYLVNNYSTTAKCLLLFNNKEYNIVLTPGSIKKIKIEIPHQFNIVRLSCNKNAYTTLRQIEAVDYHKTINLKDYFSLKIQEINNEFQILVSNKLNRNVVCFVSVYDSKFKNKYIEVKNIVPEKSTMAWLYHLKDLNIPIKTITIIGVEVVCKGPYTTTMEVKKVLKYSFGTSYPSIIKLRKEYFKNLIKILTLYYIIKTNSTILVDWNCGNYNTLLKQLKEQIKKLGSEYAKNLNNEKGLESVIAEENYLLSQLSHYKSQILTKINNVEHEYNTYKKTFINSYNYIYTLYNILKLSKCLKNEKDIETQLNEIKMFYSEISSKEEPDCNLLKEFPSEFDKLNNINKTIQVLNVKCPTKSKILKQIILKKLKDLYNQISKFKDELFNSYKNDVTILLIQYIINDLSQLLVKCQSLINNYKSISTEKLKTEYDQIKSKFENEYENFLETIKGTCYSNIDKFHEYMVAWNIQNKNVVELYNQVKSSVDKYYNDIKEHVRSNQDMIKYSNLVKTDIHLIASEISKLSKYFTEVEIFVEDNNKNPVPFAKVYDNGKFVGYTNGNGILSFYTLKVPQIIKVVAVGYKVLKKEVSITLDNQYITLVLSPLNPSKYPPMVEHFVLSRVIHAAICSTLAHPHCLKGHIIWGGLVHLHPYDPTIQNIISHISKLHIKECKIYGVCYPLLNDLIQLIRANLQYDDACLSKDPKVFNAKCMAWWGSDIGIAEYHKGVCADYARLTVSVLRALGIPARYVVIIGKTNYLYRWFYPKTFAHAFTQVYINGHWIFFDTLWGYIKKPNYPLSCVYQVYTPYTVIENGETKTTTISLMKQMSKYYKPCPGVVASNNLPKAAPMEPQPLYDNYSCLIFLQNKTVACLVNNTLFSLPALNFNHWLNVTHIYRGFARSIIIGKLNKTLFVSYIAPGSKVNLLICGLNNSTLVSPRFVSINRTCVLYSSNLPGLFKVRIGYPPFFYSNNALIRRVALLYGYMVINNSTLAIATDEPVNISQIAILGSVNQELATLYLIKEHTCPEGVSVLNNLDIDNINNILLNKPNTLVLINYTDTLEVEHDIFTECKKQPKFKIEANPKNLYPDMSNEALNLCLLGLNYINVFV